MHQATLSRQGEGTDELPSVLQRWIDHEAKAAKLVIALAGSSQRMMQGFVLSGDAPLYGRAREILEVGPLEPTYLEEVFGPAGGIERTQTYTAWGGVPRYWELAAELQARFTRHESIRALFVPERTPSGRDEAEIEGGPGRAQTRASRMPSGGAAGRQR
jgi:hypothetical protein